MSSVFMPKSSPDRLVVSSNSDFHSYLGALVNSYFAPLFQLSYLNNFVESEEFQVRIEQLFKRSVPFCIHLFSSLKPQNEEQNTQNCHLHIGWTFQRAHHKNCSSDIDTHLDSILDNILEQTCNLSQGFSFPTQIGALSIRLTAPGELDYLHFNSQTNSFKHDIKLDNDFCILLNFVSEETYTPRHSIVSLQNNDFSITTAPSTTISENNSAINQPLNTNHLKFSLPINFDPSYCNTLFSSMESPESPNDNCSTVYPNTLNLPTDDLIFPEPIPIKRREFESSIPTSQTKRIRVQSDSDHILTPRPSRSKILGRVGPSSPMPNHKNKFNLNRSISLPCPTSSNCLLGSFEETMINGRMPPVGYLDGFKIGLAASGSFCPKHEKLNLSTAFFTNSSKEIGPIHYFGQTDISKLGRHGYHIPKQGTIQVTLFNPNNTVIKVFIIKYQLNSMPCKTQTFLRQRTLVTDKLGNSQLQYLIHLSLFCSKSDNVYLHNNIRIIFTPFCEGGHEFSTSEEIEQPSNPTFSPTSTQSKCLPRNSI